MRAVWSFWSRPFEVGQGQRWGSPLHHWLAWGLSVQAARRHYPETVLITDKRGKKLLIDELGLPFREVSTELDGLRGLDPGWWAVGKLVAYALQDRPFVHIDNDVFLWRPLPRDITQSPVFAQCPEHFDLDERSRRPAEVESAFAASALTLPVEWEWARSKWGSSLREENCGIIGGNQVEFLRHFARTATDLVLQSANAAAWARLPDKSRYNFIVEQFLLAACVEFHRFHPGTPYRGVRIKHLFASWGSATDSSQAARVGFTHLLGGAKSHPIVGARLEARMRRDDPDYFQRCKALVDE
jgi:hypothetical protein